MFGFFPNWPRHPSRFSLRITGRIGALALHIFGGLAFGLAAGLVYDLAFDTRGTARTICAGVAFGVVLGLTIWFRLPVDDAPAADPRSTLRDDRTATLVSAALLGFASGLAVVVADGPRIGVMAGVIVLVTVLASSPWMRFAVTRCWLAATGKLPLRLMTFLGQAYRLGLVRQVGAAYQFRHARLQEQLEGPAERTVARRQSNSRSASVGLAIVLVVALAVGTGVTMSSGGWLGPGHLLQFATGAPALPAQYGGCKPGPPYVTAEGASFRVQQEVHSPSGWWCRIWQGTDVGAVRARITMHSGAAAYLVVWTPDGGGGYDVGLSSDGAYRIDRNTDGVRVHRDGYSPLISSGLHQPHMVTVVDRDDTVHLYVNGAHVDAIGHRSLRGGIVGLGLANSTDPVEVAFDDVTIWSHQPPNRYG
jgi:hypothetical protein